MFEKTSVEVEQKVEEVKVEEVEAAEVVEKPQEEAQEGVLNRDKETVGLRDHIELRKQYQDEHKRRLELEQRIAATEAEQEKAGEARHLIDDLGYTEEAAKREAGRRFREKDRMDQIEKRLGLAEIRDLAKLGGVYAAAEQYTDEIWEHMKQYNIDAKRAFLLACDPETITRTLKETQTEHEQRNLLQRGETEGKKVETSSATPIRPAYKLDADDRKALKGLQLNQPESHWTVEKYVKMQYGNSPPKE